MPRLKRARLIRRADAQKDVRTIRLHKRGRPNRSARAASLLVLLLVAALLSGCNGVQVTERTTPPGPSTAQRPSSVSEIPNTRETHDLAIAAVDFDPSLNSQRIALGGPVSLLVAVENKGNRQENAITVSAQLLAQDRQQVLLQAQRTVNLLTAGDITVVRFPGTSTLPGHRSFILTVQVQAGPQETDLSNNKRVFEIELNAAN